MEKLQLYRISSVEWKPSAVVALAVSPDGSQVAAAREDGSLEVWLVSPGSVGWHCQLTIQGDPSSRVSSLVWCRPSSRSSGPGRLFSSSIDGSIMEWDLFSLRQKITLDSVGASVWQMAVEPSDDSLHSEKMNSRFKANGHVSNDSASDSESSLNEDDDNSSELHTVAMDNSSCRLAFACDDGCVRLYSVSDKDGLTYNRSFPRVSGRMLSVVWSHDTKLIFSGSNDGLIRCWDVASSREVYRITVGLGGLGSGSELCVWSLLFLRYGTLVSGDSSGSIQFWDSHHGTLLQAHTCHKGDVSTLATVPGQNRVFSAGSDGQVILYKLSADLLGSEKEEFPKEQIAKWVNVGYVRAHTHDIKALAIAVPISRDDQSSGEKLLKVRRQQKPLNFSYQKWAHSGVPMLISGGDDTKLFAYSAKEFTQFSPHDICPAPQRPLVNLVHNTALDGASVMLVQSSGYVDIFIVKLDGDVSAKSFGRKASTQLLARVKSKGSRRIISTAVSNTGVLFAYSDNVRSRPFELKKRKDGKSMWSIDKIQLPKGLPCAQSMIFTADSSRLMLAGHDGKIYIFDVNRSKLIHTFVPQRKAENMNTLPEPPITKMFTSLDGQWLAAINCFGDIHIFNLEVDRQHWFISRLNDASITAGGFPPNSSSVFVVTTSINEVYVLDVEAKQLGEWSRRYTYRLPRRFQEFPGEVIGLSFPPSSSSSVMIYSARAICLVDFEMPVDQDDDDDLPSGSATPVSKAESCKIARTKRKRKYSEHETRLNKKKNFDFVVFRDPVLFVGHLSENALLLIEKQWMEVVQNFDAPVHRHIFGT